MPLHEVAVYFFLEMTVDVISAMNSRWDKAGRPGHFSDSLAVRDELNRIVCVEATVARARTPEPP